MGIDYCILTTILIFTDTLIFLKTRINRGFLGWKFLNLRKIKLDENGLY